jgi:hypothetical protein
MKCLLFLMLAFSFYAQPAHLCTGTVNSVDVSGAGNIQVNIDGIGDGNILCSLNNLHGEYTVEACKAVLSLLLSAKMSEKKVTLYFRNDSTTACRKGDWGDLSAFGFYYIQLKN